MQTLRKNENTVTAIGSRGRNAGSPAHLRTAYSQEEIASVQGGEIFAVAAPHATRIKRAMDLALGLALAPLALVLLAPVCLLVMLDGGRPVYRHLRLGRGGRHFYCYKIRTMVPDADARLKALLDSDPLAKEEWSERFKLRADPRITRLGRILRATSFDELPQLWNILRGDMSFVGPRPIIGAELERYGGHAAAYLACSPGLSGLWQVSGRNDIAYEQRVLLDERYAREWTPALDAQILLRTLPAVFKARGSY